MSKPALVLRDDTSADRDQLLAHFDVTWRATYALGFAEWSLAHVAGPPNPVERLSGPDGRMIVAEAGGEIVGSTGYRAFITDHSR
jgi:hypothetical protein